MFTSELLTEGNIYTRKALQEQFGISNTPPFRRNGIFKPPNSQSIWLFITEQKTTDHPDLYDKLDGDILYWDGQPRGRTDKWIIEHIANGLELLVFYRKSVDEFPEAGFRYEGRFQYERHSGSRPTHFVLNRLDSTFLAAQQDVEALQIEEATVLFFKEGKMRTILTNTHERNARLRAAAVKAHGTHCHVCGFSFAEFYGPHGNGFIEVHHLYPISQYEEEKEINPYKDMITLCANCHRMVHRNPSRPLSIEELRYIIDSQCKRNGRE